MAKELYMQAKSGGEVVFEWKARDAEPGVTILSVKEMLNSVGYTLRAVIK